MENLVEKFPLIVNMKNKEEVFWIQENINNDFTDSITEEDIKDAEERLERFAPYFEKVYPETKETKGMIESPLEEINHMKEFFIKERKRELEGNLYIKLDSELPISGSIKARGGIYEVLYFAEKIALESGLLKKTDNYEILSEDKFKELFSQYSLAVGSTGNLGLSIGIMSAQLGFQVSVHMSDDAKAWKKNLLREKGAKVIEHKGNFSEAVVAGREEASKDKNCHFVDDENSKELFLGYAVAASRLKKQLDDKNIIVNEENPLFVYLPCGVGGGPGGVTYGLKKIFGENVHCFFAEPVNSPCMLLGVMTDLHDKIAVSDIGLSGKTTADGLAVDRPSKFVGQVVGNLIDGIFTIDDKSMDSLLISLYEEEEIFIEPSATAGLPGFYLVQENEEYAKRFTKTALKNANHIVWATGGSMVPTKEKQEFLQK